VVDLSNNTPMEFDRGDPTRRCTAHSSRTGERCRKWAIRGRATCATHGSGTKAAKRKARERLELAADRMARQLLRMATDDNVSDAVKLSAIRDALDRAGLKPPTTVDLEIGSRPFAQILDKMESGSRAEFRRSIGREDDSEEPLQTSINVSSCDPRTRLRRAKRIQPVVSAMVRLRSQQLQKGDPRHRVSVLWKSAVARDQRKRTANQRPFWWSCRESNPLVYQAICLLSGSFVPFRSGSVPLVTCGFVLGS
jgi:hypothetical protein